jgi:hypothetical protein
MATRMILSKELETEIGNLKKKIEKIAWSNQTSDQTAEWLDSLCAMLGELSDSNEKNTK